MNMPWFKWSLLLGPQTVYSFSPLLASFYSDTLYQLEFLVVNKQKAILDNLRKVIGCVVDWRINPNNLWPWSKLYVSITLPWPMVDRLYIPTSWLWAGHVTCFIQWNVSNHDISQRLKCTCVSGLGLSGFDVLRIYPSSHCFFSLHPQMQHVE